MSRLHYLDNAATTPVLPEVAARMGEVLEECFGNPSSLYAPGMQAQQLLQNARAVLAGALGLAPHTGGGRPEIVFTGSGTEANNLAVLGAARARRGWADTLVATGYEHPSVQNTLAHLAGAEGFRLHTVPPGPDGRVDPEALVAAVTKTTALVAVMHVNNEVGSVLDVAAVAQAVKAKNKRTAVHVDAVQSFCKLDFAPALWGVDSAALSAHKLHGPKGVGALYLRRGFHLAPVLFGGEQEGGARPGTENTPGIAGFAAAVDIALQHRAEGARTLAALHRRLLAGLGRIEGIQLNSPPGGWPGILNFSLPGVRSEVMLHFLEERGVYVSSGSACSQGAPSHTLTAMGLPAERVATALRVSPDACNTEEDIDALLAGLAEGLATLVKG